MVPRMTNGTEGTSVVMMGRQTRKMMIMGRNLSIIPTEGRMVTRDPMKAMGMQMKETRSNEMQGKPARLDRAARQPRNGRLTKPATTARLARTGKPARPAKYPKTIRPSRAVVLAALTKLTLTKLTRLTKPRPARHPILLTFQRSLIFE